MSAQTGLLDPYSAQSAGGGLSPTRNEGYPSKQTAYGDGAKNPSRGEAFQFWGRPVFKNSYGELYCPGFTGATYSKAPWDLCTLSGVKLPGISTVNIESTFSVDEKKAAGGHYARLTTLGMQLCRVQIDVQIWTPEQLRQLQNQWGSLFLNINGPPQQCVTIDHPEAAFHGVSNILLLGGTGPNPGATPGQRVFSIKAVEYRPASTKPATKTVQKPVPPKGSTLDGIETQTPGKNKKNTAP